MSSFTQTKPIPWPGGHGEAAAVVALSPAALADRYGLRFYEESDNLDFYDAAAVRLDSGRRVGLLRHHGNPSPGTELHVDAGERLLDAIREFLDAFDLHANDLTWVRSEVPLDHLRLAEEPTDR
ncbi:MAG: hypothetical protein ACJ8GN_13565 [Longimicrobiaceae bacterium]